jgi:hypothetical protein
MTFADGDETPDRRIYGRASAANQPALHSLSAAYPQAHYAGFVSPCEVLAAHKPTGRTTQPPGWSNTARQASLKLDRLRRKEAVMARTLAISPAQR